MRRHRGFDVGDLVGQRLGEVLVAGLGDDDDVLQTDVDAILGYGQRRLDGEDHAGLQHVAFDVVVDVVHFHPDPVADAIGAALGAEERDEVASSLGDLRIGEGRGVDDGGHPGERGVVHLARRPARLQLRHQRAIAAQIDRVNLALPRREAAVGREHARDVRGVVGDVRGVVEEDEVAVLEHRLAAVVVRIVGVPAGRDEREVADALRPVLAEHVVGDGRQLAFALAGPGRLHRLEDAGRRDARRLANGLDLARALDQAQAIEDRIEILDPRLRRRALIRAMNVTSRDARPSQGSAADSRSCRFTAHGVNAPSDSPRCGV